MKYLSFLGIVLFLGLYFLSHRIELDPADKEAICTDCFAEKLTLVIPEYPKAFNPSLIEDKEGFLLSFRISYNLSRTLNVFLKQPTSQVGIVRLDDQFQIISKPQILPLHGNPQDARLIRYKNKLLLFYNESGRMHLASLLENFEIEKEQLLLCEGGLQKVEKNWSPFVFNEELYVIYQPTPHTILKVDLENGFCHALEKTETRAWDFGAMRGGTPALACSKGYLTFFHSYKPAINFWPKRRRAYLMGAYIFDEKPPFKMRQISESPLAFKDDYEDENPKKILYPTGLSAKGDNIYLAYGQNDSAICIARVDLKALFSKMRGVE